MRKKNMCVVVWRDMLTQIRNYKWFKSNRDNGSITFFLGDIFFMYYAINMGCI